MVFVIDLVLCAIVLTLDHFRMKKVVRDESKEVCVACGEETRYYKYTPIKKRRNYRKGRGQYCDACAEFVLHRVR